MSMSEKIRILLVKNNNMSDAALSRLIGQSPQNLSNKFKRNNFTEKELEKIADSLGWKYKSVFVNENTGEEI